MSKDLVIAICMVYPWVIILIATLSNSHISSNAMALIIFVPLIIALIIAKLTKIK